MEIESYFSGRDTEAWAKKKFQGELSPFREADFQTKRKFFEVKSCNLFNKNGRRKNPDGSYSPIFQRGRFWIDNCNHLRMIEIAKENKKTPVYLFVIVIGKKRLHKIVPWSSVKIDKEKRYTYVRVCDIFAEV